jgi:dolichyl-phosphate-mannose-protein mannosyltransferase
MNIFIHQWKRAWSATTSLITSTPALLFAFFACLYLFTNHDHVLSYDGIAMFQTTQSLADHGSLAISSGGALGRDGLYYSKYGIGQSLAELPLYLVGRFIGGFAHSQSELVVQSITMLTNPLIMALACVVFYFIVRALGYQAATAIRATVVLGLATSFWPYSKTDFSEPLLTLCLEVAVLCALLMEQRREDEGRMLRLAVVAGAALGFALLTKYAAVVFIPVICLYMTVAYPPNRRWGVWLRQQAAILLPAACFGIAVLFINWLRFGSPLATGYESFDRPFVLPLYEGLSGLLFSPHRGLLFYDPLLFAGILGLGVLIWYRRRESVLIAGLVGVSLALYGTYGAWDGGASWGPRYLVPAMPYLLLPLIALGCFGSDPQMITQRWSRPTLTALRTVTVFLIGASVLVQILGVSVNYIAYDIYWKAPDGTIAPPVYDLMRSPLVFAAWLIPVSFRFAFTNTLPATGYTSQDFPFGPPYPPNPTMPGSLGSFYIHYFWFTIWPHPLLLFLMGAVLVGAGMIVTGRKLLKRMFNSTILAQEYALEPA